MIIIDIKKQYYTLTAAERRVADYVLNKPQAVLDMTVYSLSEVCGVAPSAVIRFCKKVGIDGFSQLKIKVARELGAVDNEIPLPVAKHSDDIETTVQKVFETGISALADTKKILDFKKVEEITRLISSAKRIFIFAVGTSSIVATDAQYRLSQLGLFATAYTDVLFMNVSAVNLQSGDVVLAISHSGQTKAVVDAVRHAKKAGAKTVAITSFTDSMLYNSCDVAISVFADEINYPVEAVSARLAHICLLDAIEMSLATSVESLKGKIKARNKILKSIRYNKKESFK